ncbi:MAG: ComF family protein [Rhodospirillaceae bacterium]|nr:ComF family protein [Rhodospirillaceae bacterium]
MRQAVEAGLSIARRAGRGLLNALLPPQCLACEANVDEPGSLCAECFGRFTFITRPYCQVCCLPFETAAIDDEVMCGACLKDRPAYRHARAVFVYRDQGRDLVLKLKHADRTDAAVHLAKWLIRAGGEVLSGADMLVPVPMHRRRLWLRTYNQAALLANALASLAAKPCCPDALERRKSTKSQGGLNRAARRLNVAGAFAVNRPDRVRGKNVVLVDDVLTTGATADACARTLLRAGAAAVDVLVLARVPPPGT